MFSMVMITYVQEDIKTYYAPEVMNNFCYVLETPELQFSNNSATKRQQQRDTQKTG